MTGFQDQLESIIAVTGESQRHKITYKPVFGAVAAYADDRIFLTCGKFGVAAKLPDEVCSALLAEGMATPLRYFDKGHVKRNYVVLRDDLLKNGGRMHELVRQSAAFVQNASGKT
jgi:TfoX/Sxy family transcriptional regulator of competence genes